MATKQIVLDDATAALAVTEADLPGIIAGMKGKVSAAKKAGGSLMVAGAYATHTVYRLRGDEWNATKYAAELGTDETTKENLVHRSTVGLWKGLGVALVDLGVEPDSADWTRLAGKAGANSKPIAGILAGNGRDGKGKGKVLPTKEDLAWGLDVAFLKDEEGNLTMNKRPTKEIAALLETELGEAVALTPAQVEEARVKDVNKRVKDSVEYAAKNLQDLTPEAWEVLRGTVAEIMKKATALDEARKAAAEQAAKDAEAA